MKIQVTEEHIRQGKPKDTASCPIALAIKDNPAFEKAAGSVEELGVGYNYSLADGERTVVADVRKEGLLKSRFKLPDDALQFVKQFDKGEPVEPTEFELTKAPVQKSAKKKSAGKAEDAVQPAKTSVQKSAKKKSTGKAEDAVQSSEPEPAKVPAKKSAKKKTAKKATKKAEDTVQLAKPKPAKVSAKKSAKKKTAKKAAKKTAKKAASTKKTTKKAAKKAAK